MTIEIRSRLNDRTVAFPIPRKAVTGSVVRGTRCLWPVDRGVVSNQGSISRHRL
jgi:hypothetical protein